MKFPIFFIKNLRIKELLSFKGESRTIEMDIW